MFMDTMGCKSFVFKSSFYKRLLAAGASISAYSSEIQPLQALCKTGFSMLYINKINVRPHLGLTQINIFDCGLLIEQNTMSELEDKNRNIHKVYSCDVMNDIFHVWFIRKVLFLTLLRHLKYKNKSEKPT